MSIGTITATITVVVRRPRPRAARRMSMDSKEATRAMTTGR